MSTTTDNSIRDAARRLVQGFSAIPSDWAQAVAQHIDEDHYVPVPMWGTLFKVEDSADERGIRRLLRPIGVSQADDLDDIREFAEERGIDVDFSEFFEGDTDELTDNDKAGLGDPDDYDIEGIVDAVMEAWHDSCDEDALLASYGWEAVGDTGILAREFDGHLLLGIDGAGYDFYESHWERLYLALGYRWHGKSGAE